MLIVLPKIIVIVIYQPYNTLRSDGGTKPKYSSESHSLRTDQLYNCLIFNGFDNG